MEYLKLTNETIDLLSEKISEMYSKAGCSKKDILRAQLLLEEALIKYQKHVGEEVELYYRSYKIFGQYRFAVRIRSAAFDPFSLEENPMAFMIQSIMSSFENGMPTWKYKNLENEIVFTVRKKAAISGLSKIGIGVGAAVILGILARLFIPAESISSFVTGYIDPFSNAFSGLFCVMAVLLTFFAISLSIVHMGDIASVGALGGKIISHYILGGLVFSVLVTLPLIPFIGISSTGTTNVEAKSIYDILIGFFPSNIVAPFLNFNSVQIMIVGAMFGFSLLAMGQKGGTLTEAFEEGNLVAIFTNNFLNKFIFVFVACKIFSLITTSNLSELAGTGKMILAMMIALIVLFLFYMFYIPFRNEIPLKKYVKDNIPSFIIALSSANLGAAFSCMYEAAAKSNVDGDTLNISINLGTVFFKPASTVMLIIASLFTASECGLEISITWIIIAILLSVILAGTMPSIPGASIAVVAILFTQLGIPSEALSVVITVLALMQFPAVAVDIWSLQGEIYRLKAK